MLIDLTLPEVQQKQQLLFRNSSRNFLIYQTSMNVDIRTWFTLL